MGGLLHLVHRRGAWAGCRPAQSPHRCTKCNSPPINGQCTNFILFDVALLPVSNTVICTLAVDGWAVNIWYSEEGPARAVAPPSPLIAAPNVTAHPSTASVPTSYYSMWHCYRCPLKGLSITHHGTLSSSFICSVKWKNTVE